MESQAEPLVSVVTPVYNGERYLEECIQSVLAQTHKHLEYVIANNCSTDASLEIATYYSKLDDRIRVCDFTEFVDVIESHNRAFGLISTASRYCKLVSADDCLFPECIERMVTLATENPNVGVVGAYALTGGGADFRVRFDGLPYGRTVISGREVCRSHFLGGRYFLGIPTSVLYRSDLVRRRDRFFPNPREHADISVFYECLLVADFGFVHQVLAYERTHESALGTKAKRLYTSVGSSLLDLRQYGPSFLSDDEFKTRFRDASSGYLDTIATGLVNLKGREFWKYHKSVLEEANCRFWRIRLLSALLLKIADLILNPKQTIEKIWRRGHEIRSTHPETWSPQAYVRGDRTSCPDT